MPASEELRQELQVVRGWGMAEAPGKGPGMDTDPLLTIGSGPCGAGRGDATYPGTAGAGNSERARAKH